MILERGKTILISAGNNIGVEVHIPHDRTQTSTSGGSSPVRVWFSFFFAQLILVRCPGRSSCPSREPENPGDGLEGKMRPHVVCDWKEDWSNEEIGVDQECPDTLQIGTSAQYSPFLVWRDGEG